MSRFLILLTCFLIHLQLLFASNAHFNEEKVDFYVDRFKYLAISEMDRTGIPASIKLAQALLESGVGESELAKNANNHFGIKCGGEVWEGPSYFMWDDEKVKSCFRVYPDVESSYYAHSDFLMNPKKEFRYGFLFSLNKMDFKAWAIGLQKAGYATSRSYAAGLIALIEKFELYKLDHLSTHQVWVESELKISVSTVIDQKSLKIDQPIDKLIPSSSVTIQLDVPQKEEFTKAVFSWNDIRTVYAREGDDLKKLSRRYNISLSKLKKFNNRKLQKIPNGTHIYLEARQNCYKCGNNLPRIHFVEKDQDLRWIAQYYGIKYPKIVQYNRALYKDGLKIGSCVYLGPKPN